MTVEAERAYGIQGPGKQEAAPGTRRTYTHLSGKTPKRSLPTTLRPLMASDLAESPSVRISVHVWLLRPPASLASSSLGMPGVAGGQGFGRKRGVYIFALARMGNRRGPDRGQGVETHGKQMAADGRRGQRGGGAGFCFRGEHGADTSAAGSRGNEVKGERMGLQIEGRAVCAGAPGRTGDGRNAACTRMGQATARKVTCLRRCGTATGSGCASTCGQRRCGAEEWRPWRWQLGLNDDREPSPRRPY